MEAITLFIISIIITIALFAFLIYFINSSFKKLQDTSSIDKKDEILTKWLENIQGTMDNRLKDVSNQLNQTTNTLNRQVQESSKNMNERLENASRVIGDVKKDLGSINEMNRNMKGLQDFFRSPKLRGNIGEEVLKDLLSQMLPYEYYNLQHSFKSGERVDALLKVEEGYISVDSKFPMENFNLIFQAETEELREAGRREFIKNVKKHIDDISKKYIVPDEGTVDFALMYIPSEAIYYEVVVNNPELGKYSWSKRVLPVSPNVFYSYLKAILIGLEGKKVESRAKEILIMIRSIKEDSNKFGESLKLLNKHLTNAKNTADDASKKYEKLDNRIENINKIGQTEKNKEVPDIIESDNDLDNRLL